ncbi:uncharacterized protein Z519_07318 [Cladophialophora bantiana CBS 173.52]|uniref:Clr5 domain-containing protein n=1 Tax=Cladophialophora bantiana (strain ATCC 10958 / CBS 173.52 / CDC B-1940 / NIH 8579) TaxID=1442370 RepID=A0A0D2I621_CLAB1|nr:uncharacterized protein Z519_07318 [Cladophialophora bantiana CBS 173.52]KIW92334.1 hypothetical protein Z519_07318 [Cladophialophora bantiana CBS 173.52]
MPNLVFIDVQDSSGHNQNIIRRHVAEGIQRQKRLVDVFRYQNHLAARQPLAIRPQRRVQQIGEDETGEELSPTQNAAPLTRPYLLQARRKKHTRDPKSALMFRWRAGGPTAVKPPSDDLKIEHVLSESFNWMMGQYTTSWSSLVQRDPTVFDLNGEVEIFREAFYVVTDLLELGKMDTAFAVLRQTLDAIPPIFRNPHPELLFTLVELAYGINMANASDLHAKIRPHVADLASTILGTKHPLTILLKSEFSAALKTHVTELVFKCIIDALSKTFGNDAYQTLVQQMGRSQFYSRTGRSEEGQRLIADIQNRWMQQYGANSALARLAELELCLMRLQGSRHLGQGSRLDPALEAQANNAMLRIEVMAGVYSNKFTDKPSDRPKVQNQSPMTMALAQWFLQNKRYSFALHCYERAKQSTADSHHTSNRPLADLIADTTESALRDMFWQPNALLILPSQASVQENVMAIS